MVDLSIRSSTVSGQRALNHLCSGLIGDPGIFVYHVISVQISQFMVYNTRVRMDTAPSIPALRQWRRITSKKCAPFRHEGPYFLGGLCFGGMVAFEMARQLLEQGQEVALLVLLDPSEPRSENFSSAHKDVPNLSSQITWFRNKA